MTIIIKTDAKSLSLVGVKGHFYHVRVKLSTLNANYLLLSPAFCLQSVGLQLNMILPLQIFCVSLENNQHTQGECSNYEKGYSVCINYLIEASPKFGINKWGLVFLINRIMMGNFVISKTIIRTINQIYCLNR